MTLGLLGGLAIWTDQRPANAVAAFVCSQPGATPPLPAHLRAVVSNPLTVSCVIHFIALFASRHRRRSRKTEPFRPQFHFTPEKNWMNDPNGMVFYEGEWHLFYQYNPHGNKWGHMSWGHAVSRDLVRWEHLPLALAEENGVMIFSGSAVVDWKNTSGFGKDGKPPLVAIYTGHYTKKPLQNQHIAYSNDRGRTWTKFSGNPVLDVKMADFRDPKVFWHEATERWVMTVALAQEKKVHFYASPDLKEWKYVGEFGPAGRDGRTVGMSRSFPARHRGRRDEVGAHCEHQSRRPGGRLGLPVFRRRLRRRALQSGPAPPRSGPTTARISTPRVSWSDVPKADGRRVWLGWMSNWDYAEKVPTHPWRSAMSVPRELTLRRTPDGLRLVQRARRRIAETARTGAAPIPWWHFRPPAAGGC